ncbi:MAG: hypothetical protein Q9160_001752 [Pyrenula sp. 1 TL-2023]
MSQHEEAFYEDKYCVLSDGPLAQALVECQRRGVAELQSTHLITNVLLPPTPAGSALNSATNLNNAVEQSLIRVSADRQCQWIRFGETTLPMLLQRGSRPFSLPPEIVRMICQFMFCTGLNADGNLQIDTPCQAQNRHSAQALRTCKQFYNTGISVLYGENPFDLSNESARKRFFNNVNHNNIKLMKRITVSNLENFFKTEIKAGGIIENLHELTLTDSSALRLKTHDVPHGWKASSNAFCRHVELLVQILEPESKCKLKNVSGAP